MEQARARYSTDEYVSEKLLQVYERILTYLVYERISYVSEKVTFDVLPWAVLWRCLEWCLAVGF